jgi:hypothetical protein
MDGPNRVLPFIAFGYVVACASGTVSTMPGPDAALDAIREASPEIQEASRDGIVPDSRDDGAADSPSDAPISEASDGAVCLETQSDRDAGTIGCGPIACPVQATPICLYGNRHDGSCYNATYCLAMPLECASSPNCGCLMALRDDAGVPEGSPPPIADAERFCGTDGLSTNFCSEDTGGFVIHCNPI